LCFHLALTPLLFFECRPHIGLPTRFCVWASSRQLKTVCVAVKRKHWVRMSADGNTRKFGHRCCGKCLDDADPEKRPKKTAQPQVQRSPHVDRSFQNQIFIEHQEAERGKDTTPNGA